MIEVKGVVRSPTFFHLTQLFIGKQTFRQVFILAKLHSLFQQIILLQLKIVKHTHTHVLGKKANLTHPDTLSPPCLAWSGTTMTIGWDDRADSDNGGRVTLEMQSSTDVIDLEQEFSCRDFENEHWRKVKQMQPMRLWGHKYPELTLNKSWM